MSSNSDWCCDLQFDLKSFILLHYHPSAKERICFQCLNGVRTARFHPCLSNCRHMTNCFAGHLWNWALTLDYPHILHCLGTPPQVHRQQVPFWPGFGACSTWRFCEDTVWSAVTGLGRRWSRRACRSRRLALVREACSTWPGAIGTD